MSVRLLAPDDWEIFRAIRLEALSRAPEAFSSTLEGWADLPESEWRARIARAPTFAAFEGGEAVGLAGLMPRPPGRAAHRGTLVAMYLRASARGGGLAGALVEAVIGHARDLGLRQVELDVNAGNARAIAFYRRLGFREFGRLPGAYRVDGGFADEILMWRRV